MTDLALAMLNTDPRSNQPIELRAHQTLERMNQPWLRRTLSRMSLKLATDAHNLVSNNSN